MLDNQLHHLVKFREHWFEIVTRRRLEVSRQINGRNEQTCQKKFFLPSNKQTNRQTDPNAIPSPLTRVIRTALRREQFTFSIPLIARIDTKNNWWLNPVPGHANSVQISSQSDEN